MPDEEPWWDEIRSSPLAAVTFALLAVFAVAILAVVGIQLSGHISLEASNYWTLRLFAALCFVGIAYGAVRALQVVKRSRRSGFEVEDRNEKT